ncbi:MAG: hypothetical protein EA368_06590 [Leptolyngbya sp. DLM2.Bin27]|nr:MAG: hypothetical protein EA368_06590 [Leptolyngbya sp. DLM2.Bin27]
MPKQAQLSPALPTQAGSAGSPPSQTNQLRSRVQRLRAQHGSRLAPSTPVATVPAAQVTPSPRAASPPASSRQGSILQADWPQPSPVVFAGADAASDAAAGQITANPGDAVPSPPERLTPQASPSGPGELSLPQLGTATDLRGVATANLARSHQGHSRRTQGRATVLSPPASPSLTATRLHGGTRVTRASQPEATAPQAELPAFSPAPAADTGGILTTAIAAPAFTAAPATAHQPSGSTATPARQSPGNRASQPGDGAHQDQGRTLDLAPGASASAIGARSTPIEPTRPAQATALPESLPLHSGAPRLSPPRAVDSHRSQRPFQSDQGLSDMGPEGMASSDQTDLAKPAAAAADPAPAPPVPAAPTLGHRAQANGEAIQLTPPDRATSASPKGLPVNYCLSASELPPTVEGQAQADTAPMPKFSAAGQIDLNPPQESHLALAHGANSAANPCHSSAADPELTLAPD